MKQMPSIVDWFFVHLQDIFKHLIDKLFCL